MDLGLDARDLSNFERARHYDLIEGSRFRPALPGVFFLQF